MSIPNSPIVNAGLLYVNGLGIAKTAAKVISMAAGAARNSTDVDDITLNALVSIDGAKVGANGVDVAAIIASNFYAVYVIGDSTGYQPTAGLLSLNFTQPSLPGGIPSGGYDMYRRVGWVLTDGSANILQFWQYGTGQARMYYYDVAISELSGGTNTGSFVGISLAASVPPLATEVLLRYTFTPGGATDVAEFLPFGSSAAAGIVQVGSGVAVAQVGMVTVPCALNSGVPTVLYQVSGTDSLTVLTSGYKDILS